MPDYTARKRLKQKMLDRWENEGGKVAADSITAKESGPFSSSEGDSDQPVPSANDSNVSARGSATKKRKSILKSRATK